MKDPGLAGLVHCLGWQEGLPVVSDPGIIDRYDFTVSPNRIGIFCEVSVAIRLGVSPRNGFGKRPFVFAAWCRYLMGIADDGEPVELSSDPLLGQLESVGIGIFCEVSVAIRLGVSPRNGFGKRSSSTSRKNSLGSIIPGSLTTG
jgi:fructuronate reductase